MTTNVGIRISAQDDTGKAFATVRQNLSGMQKDAAGAGGAFAGMADKIGPLAASLAAAYSVG
ncbi:hypothetical protein ACE4ZU_26475, partial [Salmonella enterica]|uniref:hypothetical protein n=1 Tax=Salmonella enterica TaxID=28901 RepID=UPI003D2C56BD